MEVPRPGFGKGPLVAADAVGLLMFMLRIRTIRYTIDLFVFTLLFTLRILDSLRSSDCKLVAAPPMIGPCS